MSLPANFNPFDFGFRRFACPACGHDQGGQLIASRRPAGSVLCDTCSFVLMVREDASELYGWSEIEQSEIQHKSGIDMIGSGAGPGHASRENRDKPMHAHRPRTVTVSAPRLPPDHKPLNSFAETTAPEPEPVTPEPAPDPEPDATTPTHDHGGSTVPRSKKPQTPCIVPECGKNAVAHSICSTHYNRWSTQGKGNVAEWIASGKCYHVRQSKGEKATTATEPAPVTPAAKPVHVVQRPFPFATFKPVAATDTPIDNTLPGFQAVVLTERAVQVGVLGSYVTIADRAGKIVAQVRIGGAA
jgi:hypothetical protein